MTFWQIHVALDECVYNFVYACCASEYRDEDGMAVVTDNVAVCYVTLQICNTILTLVIVTSGSFSILNDLNSGSQCALYLLKCIFRRTFFSLINLAHL